ncbi:MAG: class I SAM-dependent methyltransferase [Candidatus Binataceae bacterium]|nr:class I SAM-dependent methyltransferase [Candidatus Binataceae bacterium]
MTKGSGRHCLGCSSLLPDPFLDLGSTPLANAYLHPERERTPEESFPLAVAYCTKCHLVQLADRVPPDRMFSKYLYFSSYSDSFLHHAYRMANEMTQRFGLGGTSRVLEIASNDGYLLQYFLQRGVRVMGVEPAGNIAAEAARKGIPTLTSFFGPEVVPEIEARFGTADLIIGNNVLAHVPAINDFLSAAVACLKPDGAVVFEFPHIKELLDKTEFDTIYHEHVFYYSLSAVEVIARRSGLELFDVEPQPIHGGSLRIFLQHSGRRPVAARVEATLKRERDEGLTTADHFVSFGLQVEALKRRLVQMLQQLKSGGNRLAAYGAPAKGNTLLNYCGIGPELLEFTVDRSPHKQGMLLPGSRLPILPPEELLRRMPDYAVILPWNIAGEIVEQQWEYLRAGGRFIVPIPEPRIVEHSG